MSDHPQVSTPDDFQIWTRVQLAKIDQLHADAERRRQEIEMTPKLLHVEIWKLVIASIAAVGILCGVLGYKIGATPPAPIVIQLAK